MLRSWPEVELMIYRMQQPELERRLELARLAAAGAMDGRSFRAILLSSLGDALIRAGVALKERAKPAQPSSSGSPSVDGLVCD